MRSATRRGITLIEIVVAVAVLAALLATSARMLGALADRQRAAERHTLAIETVQAMVEQLANLPWDELDAEAADRLAVPEKVQSYLPTAQLDAAVVDEHDPVTAKRISLTLTWTNPGGRPAPPVRLTAWAFPDQSPNEE